MNYHPMPVAKLNLAATIHLAPAEPSLLSAEAPALLAFTDFRHIRAVTVDAQRGIDDALRDMIDAGVRSLLVMRDGQLAGLITSYDIQGEKPLLFLRDACTHEQCRHQDVRVADVMTAIADVPSVTLDLLPASRLGDLLATFERHPDWMHLLVTGPRAQRPSTVCGLISRTQIHRLLQQPRSTS